MKQSIETKNKRYMQVFCLLAISFLIEILIFNFRSIQSLFYQEQEVTGEHIRVDGFDAYTMEGHELYVLSDGYDVGVVYLTGLDQLTDRVHNLYLEWGLPAAQDNPYEVSGICTITPLIRDEGHDQYTQLADHVYRQDIETSKYMWIQGMGRVRTIVLKTGFSEQGALQIKRVVINARRPIQFSAIRCIIIFVLLLAVAGIRNAVWERIEDNRNNRWQEMGIVIAVGAALIFPAIILLNANDYIQKDRHFQPYQLLAEAFSAGQTSLLIEPSEELKRMDNPYDYTARVGLGLEEGVDYLWDTAYYKGHYYTYFGVVPCLLFYFPVWEMTHQHISETTVVLWCAVFFYIGVHLLIRSICRWGYQKIPFVLQMIATVTVFLGSNMMACLANPDAHDIPRLCGIVFLMWGGYFWVSAIREHDAVEEKLILWRVVVGALCMALAVGCRPNLALYSFVAPALFWRFRKAGQGEEGKTVWKRYLALIGPYIPVAVALMYYNQIRFESPFDFGFAYNLTMQDCSRTVISLDKMVLGIYGYLLKMPQMDYQFPYLLSGEFAELNRIGHTTVYITYCFGGVLICNLVTWCIPVLFKKEGDNRTPLILLLVVILQIIVNCFTGGVSYNYMADFASPLLVVSWIAAFQCWEVLKEKQSIRMFQGFLLLGLAWSVWFHINFYFVSTLDIGNTQLYYRIAYAFNFF